MHPIMVKAFSEELTGIFEKTALSLRLPVPNLVPTAASATKALKPNIVKAAPTIGRAPTITNKPGNPVGGKEGLWTRMGKSLGLIAERSGGGRAGFAVPSKPVKIGQTPVAKPQGQWQGKGKLEVEGWGEGPRKVTGFGGQPLPL